MFSQPKAEPKPKVKPQDFIAESLAQKRDAIRAENEPKPKEPEPEEPAGPPEPKKKYTPWRPRTKKKKEDRKEPHSCRKTDSPKVVEPRVTDTPKLSDGKKDPPSVAERIKFETAEDDPPPTIPSQSGVSRPPENSKEARRPDPPSSPSLSDPPSPQAALPGGKPKHSFIYLNLSKIKTNISGLSGGK